MRTKPLAIAIFVLVAAVAAWRLWRSPANAGNLEIVPDSVEYAVAADRFVEHHGYTLLVDGVERPPRYSPWFSLGLLAPFIAIAGGELGAAIVPVFALGIVSVLAAYAVGKRLAGAWGAAGAALALLLNPAFAALARLVMTEVPAVALGLFGCVVYLRPPSTTPARRYALAGLIGAQAFAFRSEFGAILLPFAGRILWSERRRAASFALLVAPTLLVAAATGWYDQTTFGSWLRSGYQYWCPDPYEFPHLTWGLRFIGPNLERLLTAPRIAVLVLGAAGAAVLFVRSRDAARGALTYFALAALPGTLLHLIYFYPEARFHVFVLALASVFFGAGLGSLAGAGLRETLWPIPILVVLAAFVPPKEPLPPPYRLLVAEALARETPKDAVVVSGLDPVFLEPHLLRGTSRTIVPASRSVEYASKRIAPTPGERIDPCPVVATESRDKLAAWVREGRPVFIDASFLPEDARLARILDPSLTVVPNPRFKWLGQLRLR